MKRWMSPFQLEQKDGPEKQLPYSPTVHWLVQPVKLTADDGVSKIEAFVNKGPSSIAHNFDCHGLTFANGQAWINNDQIEKLLNADHYIRIGLASDRTKEPQVGDVVIYRMGGVVHSATVVTPNCDWMKCMVREKGGIEDQIYIKTCETGCRRCVDKPRSDSSLL